MHMYNSESCRYLTEIHITFAVVNPIKYKFYVNDIQLAQKCTYMDMDFYVTSKVAH